MPKKTMQLNRSLTQRARARRKTVMGIAVSILLHIGLFALLWSQIDEVRPPVTAPANKDPAPLVVTFLKPPPTPSTAISVPPPKSTQPPKPVVRPPKAAKPPPPKVVVRRPAKPMATIPISPAPSPLQATAPEIKPAPPEMDMSSMLNAARERRRAEAEAEGRPDPDPGAVQANKGPADNAIAKANIQFLNQQSEGGGGVFQIMNKGPRIAQYAFRGWGGTARENRRQLITVDAGVDGDVNAAIIKSMIALIRKRYPGNFSWDSQRLGRVVELSARETDGAALQAFLMREFFGGS
ncbi:hypothetical protein [Glaciimonas sp. GG7]